VKKKDKPTKYSVGYQCPPRANQYKPGTSGNPNGRPKGSLNLIAALQRELRRPVVVNEHGRRRTITMLEAALKQLVNKSASGDMNATKLLLALLRAGEEQQVLDAPVTKDLGETDQKVIRNLLKRLNRSVKGDQQ
jgi:Family of unknown function (DUF5681)